MFQGLLKLSAFWLGADACCAKKCTYFNAWLARRRNDEPACTARWWWATICIYGFPGLTLMCSCVLQAVPEALCRRRRSSTDFAESCSPPSSTRTNLPGPRHRLRGSHLALAAATQAGLPASLILPCFHTCPQSPTPYTMACLLSERGRAPASSQAMVGSLQQPAAVQLLNRIRLRFSECASENLRRLQSVVRAGPGRP